MGRSNGCEANRKREDAKKRAEKYSKEGIYYYTNSIAMANFNKYIVFQELSNIQLD